MDDLERELRELSRWLETPSPPDVTAQVRARLTAVTASAPAVRKRRWRWRYAVAATLAALLVAVLPPGRTALADAAAGLLRFAGITISTSPTPVLPAGSPSPLPAQRAAGLDEAQRAVRFPIRVPAKLGPPEQVLVADPDGAGNHRVATLLYRRGALRLDAFDGQLDPVFFKEAGGPGAEWTQVGGRQAVWIGGPHSVSYMDRDGVVRQESARLAGATLVWEGAGVTYRLEGELTMAEAVEIAASLE
ncbi:hypothetical protein MCAG_01464 [Micromonospora sp. ATCC 39149]|uniref:DUF4367 domain-containing protein n=1 Tax=Micromonospora carbonacea TaxID=47853 RepID=A0A7D6CES7_9ACTN|nr:hypothetical protein [Micromonospora sp. ATCC 39149]EEP71137.1 hypothetical protein MCAG_01464 [Micromonospora sp. ATCC 39149]QLJ97448.1 hypothetical protein HZU44_21900 [Micromonospora carbonacea]